MSFINYRFRIHLKDLKLNNPPIADIPVWKSWPKHLMEVRVMPSPGWLVSQGVFGASPGRVYLLLHLFAIAGVPLRRT